MRLVGAPILGGFSDRFRRKPVLLVSQFGTFVGFLLPGFASSLPLLFISRIIDGLSGANIVAAQAAITDISRRAQASHCSLAISMWTWRAGQYSTIACRLS